MATTYTLIESYTVGSGGVSSITLGSGGTIPQTYTDLKIVCSLRASNTNAIYNYATFNTTGITAWARGDGTGVSGGNIGTLGYFGFYPSATATSNTFGNWEFYISSYKTDDRVFFSESVMENNATSSYSDIVVAYGGATPLTSITISNLSSGNFVQYSTIYLYGIKNS